MSDVLPLGNDEEAAQVAHLIGGMGDEPLKAARKWRREIAGRGLYWGWRTGSGANRPYRYGGTTVKLFAAYPELREKYEQDKKREADRRAKG